MSDPVEGAVAPDAGAEVRVRKDGGLRIHILTAAVALMVVAVLVLASGPLLYRGGVLGLDAAQSQTMSWGLLASLIAGTIGLVGLIWSAMLNSSKGVIVGALVVLACALIGGRVVGYRVQQEGLPPIHDAQTDWEMPVAYSGKTLDVRAAQDAAPIRDDARIESGDEMWSGMSFAEAQTQVYELGPMVLPNDPAEVTVAATRVAEDLGWTVMLSDPPGGQVEAVQRSFWYGAPSDIAVRVVAEGEGARIDVRSSSRIGGPDRGSNAQRIKSFLDDLAYALRGHE